MNAGIVLPAVCVKPINVNMGRAEVLAQTVTFSGRTGWITNTVIGGSFHSELCCMLPHLDIVYLSTSP